MALGKVAVVGGGINGLCIAWQLAVRGWQVELFERGRCLQQTSSASTKLLHGGLRYLEHGHLTLVAESLHERARWLREVPQHCHWLPLLLPIYQQQHRPAWQWRLGLGLYDGLALGQLPGFARWLTRDAVLTSQPLLRSAGLIGAWQFWDGQMDEQALGCWVLTQAQSHGVAVHEHCGVQRVSPDGWLEIGDGAETASKRYQLDCQCLWALGRAVAGAISAVQPGAFGFSQGKPSAGSGVTRPQLALGRSVRGSSRKSPDCFFLALSRRTSCWYDRGAPRT